MNIHDFHKSLIVPKRKGGKGLREIEGWRLDSWMISVGLERERKELDLLEPEEEDDGDGNKEKHDEEYY